MGLLRQECFLLSETNVTAAEEPGGARASRVLSHRTARRAPRQPLRPRGLGGGGVRMPRSYFQALGQNGTEFGRPCSAHFLSL